MAKPSRPDYSSDDAMSNSSAEEEEQVNDQINDEEDEEELDAVARSADDSEVEEDNSNAAVQDDDDVEEEDVAANEVSKREKARLKKMQDMKKQKIQEILDVQNAAIEADMEEDAAANEVSKRLEAGLKKILDMKKQKIQDILDVPNAGIEADMNNKGKGRLNYLLKQPELFAHFAKGDASSSKKKGKGRHDFQLFSTQRLNELYEKEARHLMQTNQRNQAKDTLEVDEPEEIGDPLTAEEKEEKERLLEEGFSTWSRKDFNAFIRAYEKYDLDDIKGIVSKTERKMDAEFERYAKVFKQKYKELNDYERMIKNIERGEAKMSRKDEIMKTIGKKLGRYQNPWLELKIEYGQEKGKLYDEECDRYMLCMVHKLGYGKWDELRTAFRASAMFSFDWFINSRTAEELEERFDTLIRLIERENQEYDERERQASKEKTT